MKFTLLFAAILVLNAAHATAQDTTVMCGGGDGYDLSPSDLLAKGNPGPVKICVVFVNFADNAGIQMTDVMRHGVWAAFQEFLEMQSNGQHHAEFSVVYDPDDLDRQRLWTAAHDCNYYSAPPQPSPYRMYWTAVPVLYAHCGELQA